MRPPENVAIREILARVVLGKSVSRDGSLPITKEAQCTSIVWIRYYPGAASSIGC
jgi:hypothetical protein